RHARCSASGHAFGVSLVDTDPSRAGPRHCVHSCALAPTAAVTKTKRKLKTFGLFMGCTSVVRDEDHATKRRKTHKISVTPRRRSFCGCARTTRSRTGRL